MGSSDISSASSPFLRRAYSIAIPRTAKTMRKPLSNELMTKISLDVNGSEVVARVKAVKAVLVPRGKVWEGKNMSWR